MDPSTPPPQPVAVAQSGNRAPSWLNVSAQPIRIEAGRYYEGRFMVSDADADPVRFLSESMPTGMSLDFEAPNTCIIRWRPEDTQIGDHEAVIVATDLRSSTPRKFFFKVVQGREWSWDSAAIPGIQYTAYLPRSRNTWGIFHGPSFEFLLAGWIHQNNKAGPSHGRVYIDFDVLSTEKSHISSAFNFTVGATASLERFPNRDWMIPFFGLEAGGFYQKQTSSFGQITPLFGIHLYAQRFMFISATGGYFFPMSSSRFDELRGWRAKVGLDFVLW